jgi:aspartate-semialdehyde dehydrogenase
LKKILILGAHSAVAKSLVECLEERDVDVELIRATTSPFLENELVLIDERVIERADIVVLAMADEQLGSVVRAKKKPLLDLTESLRDEEGARFVFPGLDPVVFDPEAPAVIPLGLGFPIVAVLRSLIDLSIRSAAVVTQESAAVRDQPGMDELSEQVRARFNMRDVEPKIFPAVLGFGTIPSAAEIDDSPEDADDVLKAAIAAGAPGIATFVMRTLVPVFSADSATLILDCEAELDADVIRAMLGKARGIHVLEEDEVPSSFDAVGRDDALVGRITIEDKRLGLWIACDRLRRGSATLAALAIESSVAN